MQSNFIHFRLYFNENNAEHWFLHCTDILKYVRPALLCLNKIQKYPHIFYNLIEFNGRKGPEFWGTIYRVGQMEFLNKNITVGEIDEIE